MTQRYNLVKGGFASLLGLAAAAATSASPIGAATAQEGTVTGVVVAATTGQPINGTQIRITGDQPGEFGGLSNANGRFLVTRVPSGTYSVAAVHVGYATATQEVTVSAGGVATVEFQLSVSAVDLDEIIVTGTAGAVERRKLGHSAASLDVGSVQETVPLEGFSQTLEGRIPGVRSIGVVGGVGASRELRIRGTDSFELSQRPVIYIDGIRVDNRGSEWGWMSQVTCCFFSGGAGEDRLSDLNPDEIDRVEVLKGPAASTLYGSEASGGVIQIFTKRGRNNSDASFSFASTVGFNRHRPNFPTTLRTRFTGEDGTVALDPNESLIENGLINTYDLSVDGGGEAVTYFVSGGFSYEEGSIKPNDQKRANLRVNLNWTAGENLTVGVTSGYVRNRIWALQSGNNWLGIYTNAMLNNPLNASAEEPYGGGLDVNVADAKAIRTYSDTDRWTGSVALTYTPRPYFQHKATLGLDAVNDQKTRDLPFGRHYTYIGTLGERNIGYRNARKYTADYTGNLDYSLSFLGDLAGSLAFGTQGYWDITSFSMATGKDFAGEGVTTVGGAARTFGDESVFEEINVGFFAQNRFDIGDLFVTAAVRVDGNSAFGENYGFQVYPKADVAYNFGDDMLPDVVSSAKLRGAVGMAGKAPGAFDQFRTYVPRTVLDDVAGVYPDNPGNADLQPETKLEYEGGVEMGLWNNRIGVDATYWHATTRNALLEIPLPPSRGFSARRLENAGEILNRGVEVAVNATIVDQSSLRWNTTINYEWTQNEVLSLGDASFADSLPIYQGTELVGWTHHRRLGNFRTGYPISMILGRQVLGWDPTEREHIRSAYSFYQGTGFPAHLASLNNDFSIGQSLRFAVQFRGEWGASMSNSDRGYGVRQFAYDEYLMHLNDDGSRTPAADSVLNRHVLAYPVDSRDHIRLQEVSFSYTLPETMSSMAGLQRTTLTLAAYNVHWWDNCNCPDPNQQYRGGSSFNTSPFLAVPQPRRFLFSLRTRF